MENIYKFCIRLIKYIKFLTSLANKMVKLNKSKETIMFIDWSKGMKCDE